MLVKCEQCETALGEKDYKEFKWAEDFIQKIDTHGFTYYQDFYDLEKAKEIGLALKSKYTNHEKQEHITTHYIWRSQDDGKVRSRHAKFDDKIFAWDEAPEGGKHPGEDYGCRCWAEPYINHNTALQEAIKQYVIYSAQDDTQSWGNIELAFHYKYGEGAPLTLHDIGLLQKVIENAKTFDQIEVGGGSIFKRVEKQIIREVRQKNKSAFKTSFQRGKYDFKNVVQSLGHVPMHGNMDINVVENGEYLIISAYIDYYFEDRFGDLSGDYDERTGNPGWDPIGAVPFYITDNWRTRLEAIIKKDPKTSKF